MLTQTNRRRLRVTGDAHGSVYLDGGDMELNLKVSNATISETAKQVGIVSYAETAGSARSAVTAKFSEQCKGTSEKANCDGEGNNITETYAKKSEIESIPKFSLDEETACLTVEYFGKKYKFVGTVV